MKLSDIVEQPRIESRFGVVRDFSVHPHSGIDVTSRVGKRGVTIPEYGRVVWCWNWRSKAGDAARSIYYGDGGEWVWGWHFARTFGMEAIWFPMVGNNCLSCSHLDIAETWKVICGYGAEMRTVRQHFNAAYNVWREFISNVEQPLLLAKGSIIGCYGSSGDSLGDHLHLERRQMRWGESAWKTVDPLDVIEEA